MKYAACYINAVVSELLANCQSLRFDYVVLHTNRNTKLQTQMVAFKRTRSFQFRFFDFVRFKIEYV